MSERIRVRWAHGYSSNDIQRINAEIPSFFNCKFGQKNRIQIIV